VTSVIIGATRPEQIDENGAASGITLPADRIERIDAILAAKSGPAASVRKR
jgi:aryl-alcohol dehydrogenase-like predicted oxidoreductase